MTDNKANAINKNFNRRELLSAAAMGGVAVAGATTMGAMPASAGVTAGSASQYWTKAKIDRYLCSQIHFSKSLELSKIVESPNLDDAEKSLALRTAHCPSCGVHIQPGVEKAGYSIGV